MNKNTIVGWLALIGLIFFVFFVIGLAVSNASPSEVHCTGTAYTVDCVTR